MSTLTQRKVHQDQPDQAGLDKDNVSASKVKYITDDQKSQHRDGEWLWILSFVLVTVCSFATRFYKIDFPSQVVFDEVHFGGFATLYLRGEYFFDLHPPLGKLLLAAVGYLLGLDPDARFDDIGTPYESLNVNYLPLRYFCAICGSFIAPLSYLILKEMGSSWVGCTLAGIILAFDNALIVESKYILLDSMHWLAAIMSVYSWIRFRKLRYESFSWSWWSWLSLTGLNLSFVASIKNMGILTVILVGFGTIVDLWELFRAKRGASYSTYAIHFLSRVLCLIILPLQFYNLFFYLHFAYLPNSGPGDRFMTPEFQSTLKGNPYNSHPVAIPYESVISLKHPLFHVSLTAGSKTYPAQYGDGRKSSQGPLVAGTEKDSSPASFWRIVPAFSDSVPSEGKSNPISKSRFLKQKDYIRFQHNKTGQFLAVRPFAAPLDPRSYELSLVPSDVTRRSDEKTWNATVFRIDLNGAKKSGTYVIARRHTMRLFQEASNSALYVQKDAILPDSFGSKLTQVSSSPDIMSMNCAWYINEVHVPKAFQDVFPEGINSFKDLEMTFPEKVDEVHDLMVKHNSFLTKKHPSQSDPITWPVGRSLVPFWRRESVPEQIVLVINPISWWFCVLALELYALIWFLDWFGSWRGVPKSGLGVNVQRYMNRALGYLVVGWAIHYLPFFLVSRTLFLHHYLLAFIFEVLCVSLFIDLVFSGGLSSTREERYIPTSMKLWRRAFQSSNSWVLRWGSILFVTVVSVLTIWSFWYFSIFTYGTRVHGPDEIRARQWLPEWTFQHM